MNNNEIKFLLDLIDNEDYLSLDRIAEELALESNRDSDKLIFLILTNKIKDSLQSRNLLLKKEVKEEDIFFDDQDIILDSPNFIPQEMIALRERGWKRINRKRNRYPTFTQEELRTKGNQIMQFAKENGTVVIVNEKGEERMTLSVFGDDDI